MSVYIHFKTRQVVVSSATRTPNEAWVTGQIERFVKTARSRGLRVRTLMRDRDTKYTTRCLERLKQLRLVDRPIQYRSLYQNAYVERVIQTIQRECLDKFLIFGERHLDCLLREYLDHYHRERPHQSLGNEPVVRPRGQKTLPTAGEPSSLRDVRCVRRLGGVLKSYSRKAA